MRDVADLAQQPGFLAELFARVHAPTQEGIDNLYAISRNLQIGALVLLVGVLSARPLRDLWERRAGVVRLDYDDRRSVAQPTGLTILEMSRIAGIPHASVCGGRGRCSTCRVRIGGPDRAKLPRAVAEEQKVLARVGAPANVRLACQLRPPPGHYRVTPLLPARPARSKPIAASPRRMAASTTSPSCSPTSAASPRSPRASCPTTSCSCSTAISAPSARRSRRRAAGSTSSSATA